MNEHFMGVALRQSFSVMGETSPNPPVGAVIVKEGKIVATGATCECGSDHAEISALKAAGENGHSVVGAEMYVSLEPCSHHGKTPPCAEAIVKAGISRVYIPLIDPNPLVSRKGVQLLKNAGVEVVIMEAFSEQAADILRPFYKRVSKRKPFIINKTAMTLDGRTASITGDSRWISSPASRLMSHRLRSKVDAIIIGKNTLLRDNPSLNVRFNDFDRGTHENLELSAQRIGGYNNFLLTSLMSGGDSSVRCGEPLRVLFGLPDPEFFTHCFFRDGNYVIYDSAQTVFKSSHKAENIKKLIEDGNLVLSEKSEKADITSKALIDLYQRGIVFGMLEGGSCLAKTFFEMGDIDQFLYYIAPKVLGGGFAPLSSDKINDISGALNLKNISYAGIDCDVMISGYSETITVKSGEICSQE